MAHLLIAHSHAHEWSGLPQKRGGSAFLSGVIHIVPDLKLPPHTRELCVTPTSCKWHKNLSSDISQDKDLVETGGKRKRDAEPSPRSTPQLWPPSALGYLMMPEPST